MKYLFINSVYGVRSTGKIVAKQCHGLQAQGHTCLAAYGRETVEDPEVRQIRIGSAADQYVHGILSRTLDLHGFCSKSATKRFLAQAEAYGPDVVWLHNLHGYYINVELLFAWLKAHPQIQVYWTLHDCWAFTGHCAYFTMARCGKWQTACRACTQRRAYPVTFGPDRSAQNFRKKRDAFTGVPKLTLVTPSQWLADLTQQSFLKEYPVQVIHNRINKTIFYPRPSDFKERYGLEKKFVVLGVAVGWEKTKGLQDFLQLRKALPECYEIVLVGTTRAQIRRLPEGILGIQRTANQQELAEIYSAADVYVNPTHQDNYPTVNLEAAACGTPVVTYCVGGSPESVLPENVVPESDIPALAQRVTAICDGKNSNIRTT